VSLLRVAACWPPRRVNRKRIWEDATFYRLPPTKTGEIQSSAVMRVTQLNACKMENFGRHWAASRLPARARPSHLCLFGLLRGRPVRTTHCAINQARSVFFCRFNPVELNLTRPANAPGCAERSNDYHSRKLKREVAPIVPVEPKAQLVLDRPAPVLSGASGAMTAASRSLAMAQQPAPVCDTCPSSGRSGKFSRPKTTQWMTAVRKYRPLADGLGNGPYRPFACLGRKGE
jgi:hypothetical protein